MIQQNTKVKPKAKSSQRGYWHQTSVFSITEAQGVEVIFCLQNKTKLCLETDLCRENRERK